MTIDRRAVIGAGLALAAAGVAGTARADTLVSDPYARVTAMKAKPGQAKAIVTALSGALGEKLSGCQYFTIATDLADPDLVWITQMWLDKDSYDAAMKVPAMAKSWAMAKSLSVAVPTDATLKPVAGQN